MNKLKKLHIIFMAILICSSNQINSMEHEIAPAKPAKRTLKQYLGEYLFENKNFSKNSFLYKKFFAPDVKYQNHIKNKQAKMTNQAPTQAPSTTNQNIPSSHSLSEPENTQTKNQTLVDIPAFSKIPVLQQDSSKEWKYDGQLLEANDQTVYGRPGLLWKHVRQQEGLNCAYHALKNISLILQDNSSSLKELNDKLQNPNSSLSKDLLSPDTLIKHIAPAVATIHEARKEAVQKELRKQGIIDNFKDLRPHLKYTQDYVDSNTGVIKINHLFGGEAERILQLEPKSLQRNILVVDGNLQNPMKQTRLKEFQAATDGKLGILWTEPGFNHWVGFVAIKENGTVNIYSLNSISKLNPPGEAALIKQLTTQVNL